MINENECDNESEYVVKCTASFVIASNAVNLIIFSRADQFSSDRRGADFPRGVHWSGTKKLTRLCLSSVAVVGYDLVI